MVIDPNAIARNITNAADRAVRRQANRSLGRSLILGEMDTIEYINLKKIFEAIGKYDVLVGISARTANREGQGINNAELAYIQTNGVSKKEARARIESEMQHTESYDEARKKVHDMYMLEHGSPAYHIPPRPIIKPALSYHRDELSESLEKALNAFLKFNIEQGERALKATGMRAQNFVREWFVNPENGWPENSPITIAMKGSNNPLIDTGELRKSITYAVEIPKSKYIDRMRKTSKKLRRE